MRDLKGYIVALCIILNKTVKNCVCLYYLKKLINNKTYKKSLSQKFTYQQQRKITLKISSFCHAWFNLIYVHISGLKIV